jgi:hypothetical protein
MQQYLQPACSFTTRERESERASERESERESLCVCGVLSLGRLSVGPPSAPLGLGSTQGVRIGTTRGNPAGTPDVAVVISLNRFVAPVDDS